MGPVSINDKTNCIIMHVSEVKVTQLCPPLCNPMDSSMEFSRPEYWSGQPFPSPGNLPNAGIEPRSPALQADSLPSEPPEKPNMAYKSTKMCFNISE